MRPIDAVSLTEGIELHRQSTDQEYEVNRQWAVGYNAGLDRALYSIAYAKTIAPPPHDPLTLEELREMDGEPVWVHSLNGDGKDIWAFVDADCEMVRIFVTRFSVKCMGTLRHFKTYGKTWLAYRRKPEEAAP